MKWRRVPGKGVLFHTGADLLSARQVADAIRDRQHLPVWNER